MISMSKDQMVKYLKDYAILCDLMIHNPKTQVFKLFQEYMIKHNRIEDCTYEYYNRMIRTYISYAYFKKFSVLEDFLLNRDDFLNNNDLKNLKNDIKKIECSVDISEKRIVKLIRNAFNHNNNPNFENFRISKSARCYEVEFKDIRTNKEKENNEPIKPFKMYFNDKYISNLYSLITKYSQNIMIISYDIPEDFDYNSINLKYDLSKIRIQRYYITKKLDKSTIEKLNELHQKEYTTKEELDNIQKEFHDLASSISQPISYSLDDSQINTIASIISRIGNNANENFLKLDQTHALYQLLNKVIPVPALKKFETDHSLIMSSFLLSMNISYEKILSDIRNIINDTAIDYETETEEYLCELLIEQGSRNEMFDLYYEMLDGVFVQDIPIITFIDSIITHCYHDDNITIDGICYDARKIRNSLVHRRWYVDQDNKIVLYDADPKNINDYKLELIGKIDIDTFIGWANNYLDNRNNLNLFSKKH